MFGRQARIPIDVSYGQPRANEISSPYEFATTLRNRLEGAYKTVRKKLGHKLDLQKEIYDQKVHGQPFEPDDIV